MFASLYLFRLSYKLVYFLFYFYYRFQFFVLFTPFLFSSLSSFLCSLSLSFSLFLYLSFRALFIFRSPPTFSLLCHQCALKASFSLSPFDNPGQNDISAKCKSPRKHFSWPRLMLTLISIHGQRTEFIYTWRTWWNTVLTVLPNTNICYRVDTDHFRTLD